MTHSTERPTVPPWLHKLFTGHQYPYVRRLAKFAQPIKPGVDRQEPTKDLIEAKFWEVYPRCWAKIMSFVGSWRSSPGLRGCANFANRRT